MDLKRQSWRINLRINFDERNQFISVVDEDDNPIAAVIYYWFARQAFYSHTEIYQ